MSLKELVISGGVVLALVLGVLGLGGSTTIVDRVENLGSASSPSVDGGCMNVNGIMDCFYRTNPISASTTCSIKSPSASSTLEHASLVLSSIPTGDTQWGIGQSASRFATTTAIVAHYDVASGAQVAIVATTTVTALTDGVVAPNTYINFKLATTTATYTGWQPTGRCEALFRVI